MSRTPAESRRARPIRRARRPRGFVPSIQPLEMRRLMAGDVYVSDLPWLSATNGWGPVERDMTNGDTAAGDGGFITLDGVPYDKGVGAHAVSDVLVVLAGRYEQFRATVGIDDDSGPYGSVAFQLWADGQLIYESPTLYGGSAALPIEVDVSGKSVLHLVTTDGGDANYFDHADWADARLTPGAPPPPAVGVVHLSDLPWASASNNVGPVGLDLSIGGRAITVDGVVYDKGLGAHAASDVHYVLGGRYERFQAVLGVDDEVYGDGSVVFQVWADGEPIYVSPTLYGDSEAVPINLDVSGYTVLRLLVTDAGDGDSYDHADWADARLVGRSASAAYAGSDGATQGSWKGTYGFDGYVLAGDAWAPPAYATVEISGADDWTWNPSTADPRALERAESAGRLAACSYTADAMTFDVDLAGGAARRVSLYMVDWDDRSRAQRVDVVDEATGVVLDSRSVSSFVGGVYLSWDVAGRVLFRVTCTGGENAVVSGLFFGPGAGEALEAPADVEATAASDSSIQVTWALSPGASGYAIERSVDGTNWVPAGTAGASATSFTDMGLTEAVQYRYRVKATAGAASSPASAPDSATTPLKAPTGLTAAFASAARVDLAWVDASGAEAYYRVEVSLDGVDWVEAATVDADATGVAVFGAFDLSLTYRYRVRALGGAGGPSAWSDVATTASIAQPAAPSNLSAASVSGNRVTLTWADNSYDEQGFKLEVSGDGSTWQDLAVAPAGATAYSVVGLTPGSTYHFRIRAFNNAGSSTAATTTAATAALPDAPTGLTVTSLSPTAVGLGWDPVPGATKYLVARRVGTGAWTVLTDEVPGDLPFYTDSTVVAGVVYTYAVASASAAGQSAGASTGPALAADGSGDFDRDGLTNLQEADFGTDPTYFDTDGDSLPDGWEARYTGFDPKSANSRQRDLDGDGLPDYDEFSYDTNPTIADTDGDGASDASEIASGSDPKDATDGGLPSPTGSRAFVQLALSTTAIWEVEIAGTRTALVGPTISFVEPRFAALNVGQTYDVHFKLRAPTSIPWLGVRIKTTYPYVYTIETSQTISPDGSFGGWGDFDARLRILKVESDFYIENDPTTDDPAVGVSGSIFADAGDAGFIPAVAGSTIAWRSSNGGSFDAGARNVADGYVEGAFTPSSSSYFQTYDLYAKVARLAFADGTVAFGDFPEIYVDTATFRAGKAANVVIRDYHDDRIAADGGSTTTITIDAYDSSGHPVEDETPVNWGIFGSGDWIQADETTKDGRAVAVLRSSIFPGTQRIGVSVDGREASTNIEYLPLIISLSVDGAGLTLGSGDTRAVTATVRDADGGAVAIGTTITWYTQKGSIAGESLVHDTAAHATLSGLGGSQLEGPGDVKAFVGSAAGSARYLWTAQPNAISAQVQHRVIAGDETEDVWYHIDQLDDSTADYFIHAGTDVLISIPDRPGAVVDVSVGEPGMQGSALLKANGATGSTTVTLDAQGQAVVRLQSTGLLPTDLLPAGLAVTLPVKVEVRQSWWEQWWNGPAPETTFYVAVQPGEVIARTLDFVKTLGWGVLTGEGDTPAAIAADIAFGLIPGIGAYTDVRDMGKELLKLWPGGESPNWATLGFSVAGVGTSFMGPEFDWLPALGKTMAKSFDASKGLWKAVMELGKHAEFGKMYQYRDTLTTLASTAWVSLKNLAERLLVKNVDDLDHLDRIVKGVGPDDTLALFNRITGAAEFGEEAAQKIFRMLGSLSPEVIADIKAAGSLDNAADAISQGLKSDRLDDFVRWLDARKTNPKARIPRTNPDESYIHEVDDILIDEGFDVKPNLIEWAHREDGNKQADRLIDNVLTEIKQLAHARQDRIVDSMRERLREAKKQSSRVIIIVKYQPGMTKPLAEAGVAKAFALDKSKELRWVRVIGDGFNLEIPRP